MKNYDELTNDLLERRDRYVAEQRQKRKKTMGLATSLCCFCLVALLGFGMWQGGLLNTNPPAITGDQTISGEKEQTDKNNSNTPNTDNQSQGEQSTLPSNNSQTGTTEENDPIRIAWVINKVEGQIGAARLNFSTDKYYSEKKTLKDITEYLGRDLSKLESVMPQGFEFYGSHETDFFYELDGDIAYDSCFFGYKSNEQYITVKVSKIGVPYDCMYMLNNPTVSNINGVEVTIGGIYKADNTGDFELIFADFSHDGLQYRVILENVSSDDYKCINSIISDLTK